MAVKTKLANISSPELLKELGSRFTHWTFYARKDVRKGESEKWAQWYGDREVCMGGLAYLSHAIARTIDAEAEETVTEVEAGAEPSADQGTENGGYL